MTQALSTRELVAVTGVTSRTLRHYDHVGLLAPSSRSRGGERLYSPADLLKLQKILLLRELGLGLDAIAKSLEEDNSIHWLRQHSEKLKKEQARLGDLVATIEITIDKLEKGEPLMPDELFEGFQNDPYEEEARERWPDKYEESQRNLRRLSKEEQKQIFEESQAGQKRMAELFRAGEPIDSVAVQNEVARHFKWLSNFWTPNKEAYIAMGEMYASDPRFAQNYEQHEVGTAVFMRDSMSFYANANLS